MAGYTPVFSSVLDGTLYGKWPHTGVWLCLLSQCDWQGNIDVVPKLLASKIGVPEEVLMQCIADFMSPDLGSRTGDMEGRRLELIDPTNRNWGWRVINHGIYREKARKSAYDAERTRSGKDAERKRAERAERERNAGKDAVPRSPDASRRVPLSDSDSDSNPNTHLGDKRGNRGEKNLGNSTDAPSMKPAINGNPKEPEDTREKARKAVRSWADWGDAEIAKVARVSIEEVQRARRDLTADG
jgi:hypothetical protein